MKKRKMNLKQMFSDYSRMLRPFWKFDKPLVILMLLYELAKQFMWSVGWLVFLKLIVDWTERGKGLYQIGLLILGLLAAELFVHLFEPVVKAHYITPHMERVKMRINHSVYDTLIRTDYQYFDTEDFYNRFTVTYGDYANRAGEALKKFSEAAAGILSLIAVFSFVAVQNWWIILLSALSTVANMFVSMKLNKVYKARDDQMAKSVREQQYFMEKQTAKETCMDIKLTKVGDIFFEKYMDAVKESVRVDKKYNLKQQAIGLLYTLNNLIYGPAVRVITCAMVLNGKAGIGTIATLITAASTLCNEFSKLSGFVEHFQKYALEGERIREFLEQPSPIEQGKRKNLPPKTDGENYAFTLQNVSFSYPESSFALKNLNMTIPAGGKIAIVGENGGGKTTLTKLLLRMYDPQSGEILLNGHPLADYDIEAVRHNIGVAFQDCPVYALSMRENLSAYCKVSDQMMHALSDRLPVDEILKKNEATYDTQITRQFDNQGIMLSGGERQRLAIARVMMKDLGMLIFDEPTAALDPLAEERLSQMILSAGNKTTTILISHRLSNVVNADYIYVFRQGEIVESGTHKDLMAANGYYAEMFTMQAKNYQNVGESA